VTDKYLTVLVVPHDERNVRRMRVSYRLVKVGITIAGILAVVVTLALMSYGRVASRATRAALLERENRRLEAENAKVDEIAENLERTERASARIREMAGLPPAEGAAGPGGAQGPLATAVIGPRGPDAGEAAPDAGEAAPAASSTAPDSVPAGWPLSLKGFETSGFSGAEGHPGVDIAVPVHTPVLATASGTVTAADSDPVYGHYVILDHGELETMYGHNAVLLVEAGERVSRGQPIAYSGNSGRSTAPHLHYEIRRAGRAIDPAPYLR
jgi:murein DD-endopeptidase MepM/ murein hydrolase activator NlpD